jgi:hypothetical protein
MQFCRPLCGEKNIYIDDDDDDNNNYNSSIKSNTLVNSVGLSIRKSTLNGDGIFIENAQRSADGVCSCDANC